MTPNIITLWWLRLRPLRPVCADDGPHRVAEVRTAGAVLHCRGCAVSFWAAS